VGLDIDRCIKWCHQSYCIVGLKPVTFSQWERIDKLEQQRGSEMGKPREKVTSLEEMVTVATTDQ